MKRLLRTVLVLSLLAVAPQLQAQQGRGMMGMLQQQNPISLILATADSLQLGLSEAEVTQMTEVRSELDAKNRPHQDAIQGLIGRLQGGGAPDPSLLDQLQQHMGPIQQANQQALTRVREMLNEEQVTKVNAMLAARQPRMGGPGGPGGGGGFGGRGQG